MIYISSLLQLFFTVTIYSFNVQTIDGSSISLNSFRGKKMLIVNTASGSKYAAQFGSLERLRQQYSDNLVIIAFPSNDFGHESGSDSVINQGVRSNYTIGYTLCSKVSTTGAMGSPVYQWLSDASQNGTISSTVNEDFFKYLIDENGYIRGVFAGSVDPMDSVVQNAINTNYN